MNLPPPNGWVSYIGADGVDAFPDANGYMWWADNIYIDGRRDDTFTAAVMRTKNGITERMPIPEICEGAIRLNWTPAGLYASSSYRGINKVWQVTQYKQFAAGVPLLIHSTTPAAVGYDESARTTASQALQEAQRATAHANAAKTLASTVNNSLTALRANVFTKAETWQKINDRLYGFFHALQINNHADSLDSAGINILYSKVRDWIWGWMKENGKL